MDKLLALLGYMTARAALGAGFTHHGRYYGIPVWLADDPVNGLTVATKWAPLEYVMTAAHVLEGFMRSVLYPDDEPCFQFQIGPRIEAK